jgi:hypothetical protein
MPINPPTLPRPWRTGPFSPLSATARLVPIMIISLFSSPHKTAFRDPELEGQTWPVFLRDAPRVPEVYSDLFLRTNAPFIASLNQPLTIARLLYENDSSSECEPMTLGVASAPSGLPPIFFFTRASQFIPLIATKSSGFTHLILRFPAISKVDEA